MDVLFWPTVKWNRFLSFWGYSDFFLSANLATERVAWHELAQLRSVTLKSVPKARSPTKPAGMTGLGPSTGGPEQRGECILLRLPQHCR
eukprot:3382375-Amphidinium_carterae.1